MLDICFPMASDDDTIPKDSALHKWYTLALEASQKLGRFIGSAALYKTQLEEAGFVDVVQTIYKWPMNRWPKDKRYKELGMLCFLHPFQSLETL